MICDRFNSAGGHRCVYCGGSLKDHLVRGSYVIAFPGWLRFEEWMQISFIKQQSN